MNLLTQKTPLELDLAAKDAHIRHCAEAAHNQAAKLRDAHAWLWELPTERLLALLNADVPKTLATFAANTALGTIVNASLDAAGLPEFATRAPVETGRADITFNGTAFALVPLPPTGPPSA